MVDFVKKQDLMTLSFENQVISQFLQLPPDFKDARKHLIYVVTDKNLYCVQRVWNIVGRAGKRLTVAKTSNESLRPG